jgi:hypothetical protein
MNNEEQLEDQRIAEHLSSEELELLRAGEARGELLVAALLHLEECEACSEKLSVSTVGEVLRAVFDEEDPFPANDSGCSSQNANHGL